MKLIMNSLNLICFFLISLLSSRAFLLQCEARRSLKQPERLMHFHASDSRRPQMKTVKHFDVYYSSSDPYYFMGSPLSLPPYDDAAALGPSSPFCIYPPFTPNPPPSTTPPSPTYLPYLPPPPPPPPSAATNPGSPEFPVPNPPDYVPSPPEFGFNPPSTTIPYLPPPPPAATNPGTPEFPVPNPPGYVPSPPEFGFNPPSITIPNPPIFGSSPPGTILPNPPIFGPGPPEYGPSPPSIVPNPPSIYVPEPPIFVPGPPIFLPPIIYPSPSAPPPPAVGLSNRGVWCLAKPTVPDPIIQEAMNYACGSGADCEAIQPTGSCYEPDTVLSHASYAFNSYFQRTKVAGATCDFGGTAVLVTKDPSYDGCHFITV